MIYISPSILSSDFANLESEFNKIQSCGADWAHIDVMDGNFVPNLTLGAPIIKCVRPHSSLIFDVHLMIDKPERYIKDFADAGADIITIHYESTENPANVLKEIRNLGCKSGISIKPNTDVYVLKDLLQYTDLVLIMSVEPGFGGQSFIPESLKKISDTKHLIDDSGYSIDLEVDGGISPKNSKAVLQAGANVIVAGSAVFKSDDMKKTIEELRTI